VRQVLRVPRPERCGDAVDARAADARAANGRAVDVDAASPHAAMAYAADDSAVPGRVANDQARTPTQ